MNIGLFIESLDKASGGPSRSVPAMAKGLSKMGVDVVMVYVRSENMNTHILDGTGVKVIALDPNPSITDLENCFVENKFDLIHTQGIWKPFYNNAVKIAREYHIPYVISPRGTLEPWAYAHNGLKKKIAMLLYERHNLQKAVCIMATAATEAINIRNLGIKSPIAIIPNGVDFNDYPCRTAENKNDIKKQLLFLSRLDPKKGIEILISAWSKLKDSYPDWVVNIVGPFEDDDYVNRIKNMISRNHLEQYVFLLPAVYGDEKYQLYVQSSLFVLPTFSENFGMAIAEAMACGLPVITTKGTPWECLNTKKLGWWIDIGEEALIAALDAALKKTHEDLFEMGQRGSKYVRTHFDFTKISSQIINMYEWINGNQTKPEFVI